MRRRSWHGGGWNLSTDFSRSIGTLESDSFGRSLVGVLLTILLVGAWAARFGLGRVTPYEVSDACVKRARLAHNFGHNDLSSFHNGLHRAVFLERLVKHAAGHPTKRALPNGDGGPARRRRNDGEAGEGLFKPTV
jgi:hypothetical protein